MTVKVLFYCVLLLFTAPTVAALKLVTLEYPPYIETRTGEIDGLAVRVVRSVFAQLSTPIEIEVLPWGRAISYIENGQADGIFTAFKTPERETFADYSNEVLFDQNIRMIRLSSSLLHWNQNEIERWSVCVVSNVSYGNWLDSMIKQDKFRQVFRVSNQEQCVRMLLSGRADYWVSNEYGAKSIAADLQVLANLHFVDPPIESTPSYIAFTKRRTHSQLISDIDEILKSMKEDGRYQKIIEGYLEQKQAQ
ncbi:substrate-binding periplasmic protein [Vibrio profundi]|uniref:substrate-binding periplasmic protein n=1 Tax=Vibrio profundi TaxID=1774960 RepID=UPI0037357708